ncbi:MAG: FKBP-type peptidyl-prolyl cis-trans isomerase [Mariprofundus sp.]
MKKTIIASVCVAMLAACSQQAEVKPAELTLDNDTAKLSYAIGMDIGASLKSLSTEFDRPALIAAINDRLDGKELKMKDEEAATVKQAFFKQQAAKREVEKKAAAETNKAAGEKFLAENAKKPGVTVTASGLQYEILTPATGAKPKASDSVKVHYRGTLLDGTEFDSSYKRGQPIIFPLNGVIKGWIEGLQLMNVGSKFKFYIPSNLAYGEGGAGNTIAPNSTLVFEVELLAIEDAAKASK